MKEIDENDVLRFTRKIPVPHRGPWQALLLCEVEKDEKVIFRGECWAVEEVSKGEFCGSPVYQSKLVRVPGPPPDKEQG